MSKIRESTDKPNEKQEEADQEVLKVTAPTQIDDDDIEVDPKSESELGLISTILGCRENRDRIELARDLKEYIKKLDMTIEEKSSLTITHLGLASDYKLIMSVGLKKFIGEAGEPRLARSMPKYDFISPSLALIIM